MATMTNCEDALVKSVHVMDASRRVGWAKYFSSVEAADELARDLNMARSDSDLMCRFAGYLYGLVTVAAPELAVELPITMDRAGVLSMLPDESLSAGKRAGARWHRKLAKRLRSSDGVTTAYNVATPGHADILLITRPDAPARLSRGNNRIHLSYWEMRRLYSVLRVLLDGKDAPS